ncbi:MAG: hypothetical protein ACSHX9_17075 [Luteolibacter sp.]
MRFLLKAEPGGGELGKYEKVGIWMVEQQEDGSYKLMIYYNKPCEKK